MCWKEAVEKARGREATESLLLAPGAEVPGRGAGGLLVCIESRPNCVTLKTVIVFFFIKIYKRKKKGKKEKLQDEVKPEAGFCW